MREILFATQKLQIVQLGPSQSRSKPTAGSDDRFDQCLAQARLVVIGLEEVLSEHISQQLHTPELSELTGVTERALRSCCAEFLGITPSRYMLLRRLKLVRIALRDADPDAANIAELARHYGFMELGRFTTTYQAAFGETPSTTLRRGPNPRFTSL